MATSSIKGAYPIRKSNRRSKIPTLSINKDALGSPVVVLDRLKIFSSPSKDRRVEVKTGNFNQDVPGENVGVCTSKSPPAVQSPLRNALQLTQECSPTKLSASPFIGLGTATPPRASHDELRSACRRILSPSKRKGDENDSPLSVSPRKSPRCVNEPPRTPNSSRPSLGAKKGVNATPRRLFDKPEKVSCSHVSPAASPKKSHPLTPHPPKDHGNLTSKRYQKAKQALHTAKPEHLIGREMEEMEIEKFVIDNLSNKTSSSLYISGAPGTGKTAVVNHVLDHLKTSHQFPVSFINCMMLRDSNAVFGKLHEELTGEPLKVKDSMKAIEKLIVSKDSVLLVLDEIDQLDSKHQETLYRIFEWPALKGSKVILIGIANALDLTDRILPRLQASKKCRPQLMNFAPYTCGQIKNILEKRLEAETIVESSAITFCARKISAVAGDMRKALDVCRRAVEIVEADVRSQKVLKPSDCNSPLKHRLPEAVRKVNMTHISRVMADVYGSSVAVADNQNEMPIQQKLAICSLFVLTHKAKVKEVTLGKLHEGYSKVCKKKQMPCVDQSEFHSILTLMESRCMLTLKKAKDTRLSKISLKLDVQELEQVLQDKAFLSSILNDGIPK